MGKTVILNYGSGNVKSVYNLFHSITEDVVVSNSEDDIRNASHIVLPGVGAFKAAMQRIQATLPMDVIEDVVRVQKRPFLGICVGMQVMAERGNEFGVHQGLGWIPGEVNRLELADLPVPHIGWNNATPVREHALFDGLGEDPDFYFVHSYYYTCQDSSDVLSQTNYGIDYASAIQRENLMGVQFHPEKSQRAGIKLVKNFLAIS